MVVPQTGVCSSNSRAEAIYIFHKAIKIHQRFISWVTPLLLYLNIESTKLSTYATRTMPPLKTPLL